MRTVGRIVSATVVVAVFAATESAPSGASEDWGLNGTYLATSNGEWARTGDRSPESLRWLYDFDPSALPA